MRLLTPPIFALAFAAAFAAASMASAQDSGSGTMTPDPIQDHAQAVPRAGEPEHHSNRLRFEKSPYLLQHADNPVDWYPWDDAAFEKARKENRPIFLSIGYSTCHWCHVMEHESFEDIDVARLMNAVFVCIKVDREERPDVDAVYMAACQAMTGQGGWPLTIVMTPDKKPFFAGTYIPKENRFGRMGMLELVPRIEEVWKTQREKVLQSSDQIVAGLRQTSIGTADSEPGEGTLRLAFEQLLVRFDKRNAGFGNAPKFPTPHNLLFLLRYWKRTGEVRALEMVEQTLEAMRRGGIYDHIGFGFHRYATDAEWLVPHFEKMLYDQALLATAYVEAYQATGRAEYERTAREIFIYVLRDMTAPEGGFYCAEDADSEGVEGKFYLWEAKEIRAILGDEEANLFEKAFNVEKEGNYEEETTQNKSGDNILHLKKSFAELASESKIDERALREKMEDARKRLFDVREKRVHPYKDDKILTDWNGLAIAALAKGARAFDEPKYAEAAVRAAEFILKQMWTPDGRLLHRYRDGEAGVAAYLDDYAFLIQALLELYETVFDVRYLRIAFDLNADLQKRFWDAQKGGFFLTPDDGEALLLRSKEIYDGAVPSGNSVAMLNLLRLARISGDARLEEKAQAIGTAFSADIGRAPSAHTQFLVALDFGLGPSFEVVVAGDLAADDTKAMVRALRNRFEPNEVVLFRPQDQESPEIVRLAPFTQNQSSLGGKATAYVCLNQSCKLPTTSSEGMLKMLGAD